MPMPVLPEVGSISVSPGLIRPERSASSSMRTPMRSLTLPPGFKNSHFPRSSQARPLPMWLSRTIGVPPTASRIESRICSDICCALYRVALRVDHQAERLRRRDRGADRGLATRGPREPIDVGRTEVDPDLDHVDIVAARPDLTRHHAGVAAQ